MELLGSIQTLDKTLGAEGEAQPFLKGTEESIGNLRIGVFAHIFYTDLINEFISYFRSIPAPFDIHISTTKDGKPAIERELSEAFKGSDVHFEVYEVPNLGRDMGPLVVQFKRRVFEYGLVCRLHSKKNSKYGNLDGWRTYLLENLLGSTEIVASILDYFLKDANLGMIFPEDYPPIREFKAWGANFEQVKKLCKRMRVSINKDEVPDFPTGSMFWFRPCALKPLFDLDFQWTDFKVGSEKLDDGTLAHAIERVFPFILRKSQYGYKKVAFHSGS